MPAKKYRVDLTAEERDTLLGLIRSGKTAARQVTRARILLKADEGLSDEEIAEEVATSRVTVERTRQRFVEESLGALTERPRTGAPRRLTGKGAAHLIAVTCSPAPAGRERWTLRLLADEAVALGLADSLSRETVRQLRKKTNSSPGNLNNGGERKSQWKNVEKTKDFLCWLSGPKRFLPALGGDGRHASELLTLLAPYPPSPIHC
jgi:putative transposase